MILDQYQMLTMDPKSRSSSLFDDIFQLQSTVPTDIDPEDPEDGFKSALTEGATEVEVFGSTQLRKQAAIIPDDPKYRGKKISRKTLYSDDEAQESEISDMEEDRGSEDEDDDADEEGDEEEDVVEDADGKDLSEPDDVDMDEDEAEAEIADGKKEDAILMAISEANDREKGKAVSYQLGVWDDLIKCRISLQKMIASCNRLPTPDLWGKFTAFHSFQKESSDAHSSMRQVLSSMLELQHQFNDKLPNKGKGPLEGSDEEITSESEVEDEKETIKVSKHKNEDDDDEGNAKEEDEGDDEEEEDDEDEGEKMDSDEDELKDDPKDEKEGAKRKLNEVEVEETLAKRHKEFQAFRNSTLEKWDEKTRLSLAKIKSKNFSAFDISVLKQIQQVLANKERLIRRIHQNRSSLRILGQSASQEENLPKDVVVEDDEDEVELREKAIRRPETDTNYEIVDDSDFYQMCLRDFIQLKQNEETDPVLANKHWLEIQNMRKKHKRKVDTRASKGRKIRYHVKEKLKNFMAPYDKSAWSGEQKDDLFKSLFGGRQSVGAEKGHKEVDEAPTINIGL